VLENLLSHSLLTVSVLCVLRARPIVIAARIRQGMGLVELILRLLILIVMNEFTQDV
jgi:hypothetical protein